MPAAAPDAALSAPAGQLAAPVKRRTVDAVREQDGYSIADLPEDFPSGSWRDVQHAQADINTWAQDRNTGDGAFAIGRSNHRVGTRKRGEQWGVHCHRMHEATAVPQIWRLRPLRQDVWSRENCSARPQPALRHA